jgi:hypothetical protein
VKVETLGESHLNYIRHGKGKRGDELPEELGHRETRLKKIPGGQRALEARAREKAAAERCAPDQEKPKDKDRYNLHRSAIADHPARRWHHSGLQRAGGSRKPPGGR